MNRIIMSKLKSLKDILTHFQNSIKITCNKNGDKQYDVTDDAIEILDECISALNIMVKDKIGVEYMITNESVSSKYDKFSIIAKMVYVIELANRLSKLENQDKYYAYQIKDTGIVAIAKLDTENEITDKGCGVDNKGENIYTIEINKDGKQSVVSWHLGRIRPTSPLTFLVNPSHKEYRNYIGMDIKEFNQSNTTNFSTIDPSNKWNYKGISTIGEILTDRNNILDAINNNFGNIEISKEQWALLDDKIFADEKEIDDNGLTVGVLLFEKIIKEKLKNECKFNFEEKQIDDLLSKYIRTDEVIQKARIFDKNTDAMDKDNHENTYFLTRIVNKLDFSSVSNFEELENTLDEKMSALGKLKNTYNLESPEEMNLGYQMLEMLESINGEKEVGKIDFEKGVVILEKIKVFFDDKISMDTLEVFIEKLKNIFSSFDFEKRDVDAETIINSVIVYIEDELNSGKIKSQDLTSDKASEILKSIKKEINMRFIEINEEDKSTISIDEILEFIEFEDCSDERMLKSADALLRFAIKRDKSRVEGMSELEYIPILEEEQGEIPARGILDLRKRIERGEFKGGGRY